MKYIGVVIWYNPTEEDKTNINTYLNNLDKLYIYDNSPKQNVVPIKSNKIIYIFNNENLGISVVLNQVAKIALNDDYKWMLTMDQDTKMNNECFDKFNKIIKEFDTSNIGIISPWHDTRLNTNKPQNIIEYPQNVMTSGNLVNLSILKKIGYYDERFFIDGIDIEIGLRLNKLGYKILQFNDISIEHNLGNIEYHKLFNQTFMCSNHSYIRQYYIARNYRYIKDDYIDTNPNFCKKLVKEKKNIFVIIMFEKDKLRKIKYILKGIKDYQKGKTGRIEV